MNTSLTSPFEDGERWEEATKGNSQITSPLTAFSCSGKICWFQRISGRTVGRLRSNSWHWQHFQNIIGRFSLLCGHPHVLTSLQPSLCFLNASNSSLLSLMFRLLVRMVCFFPLVSGQVVVPWRDSPLPQVEHSHLVPGPSPSHYPILFSSFCQILSCFFQLMNVLSFPH